MEPDLRTQIDALEKSKPLSPEQAELLERAYREIGESGIAEGIPKAGAEAPRFVLPNAVGIPVALADVLAHGPAVVTFYRGMW